MFGLPSTGKKDQHTFSGVLTHDHLHRFALSAEQAEVPQRPLSNSPLDGGEKIPSPSMGEGQDEGYLRIGLMPSALAKLTVIEYGEHISAPFCARLLGDLGAEVIKVERPSGDPTRRNGPFPGDLPHPERGAMFHYLNFNKLGITLSVETATGRSLLEHLLREADVFVTSMSFDLAERLGLDYGALKQTTPLIVVTAVTPFGWSGPYRSHRGDAATLAHAGGWAYINPRLAQSTDIPPLTPPGQLADFIAGLAAATGTLMAIFKRNRNGFGQLVDVSVQDSALSLLRLNFARYSGTGQVDSRVGRSFGAPLHVLPCKDGYVYAQCETQEQWERFVELMGNPEWAKDELFSDRYRRADNWEALEELLKAWFSQHTKNDIYHMAQSKRVPFGPVVNAQEVRESKQLASRGFFVPIALSGGGVFHFPGSPFALSATPWMVQRPAPQIGEHNEAIYCGRLGLAKKDLVLLREGGVI